MSEYTEVWRQWLGKKINQKKRSKEKRAKFTNGKIMEDELSEIVIGLTINLRKN
ncbi:MAG: hypothetical protein IPK06_04235 [Ignavibacteriae bacterium]|nr:hypothetical protein [Ignavibacteriota bacterium]